MLCSKNVLLESRNYINGVNFTRDDPCIFITYQSGAVGDLLMSIVDKHYLQTGCEYYGIADNGRVHMFSTDYEMMDLDQRYEFTDQWFYDLASQLGSRNLNYSLLDQVIFGCHMDRPYQTQTILDTFPNAKIINIHPIDSYGQQMIKFIAMFKHKNNIEDFDNIETSSVLPVVEHERVLNIPFGAMFNQMSYNKYYDQIIDFLGLNGRLICFDYIQYYLSKQHPTIQDKLINYSKEIA
jgi:hypothetical protein